MTPPIHYATFNPDARHELRASADELMDALWVGYRYASEFYRANPTAEAWRALVRAHAVWRVAFMAGDGEVQP